MKELTKEQRADIKDICLELSDIGYRPGFGLRRVRHEDGSFPFETDPNIFYIFKGDLLPYRNNKLPATYDWYEIEDVVERLKDYAKLCEFTTEVKDCVNAYGAVIKIQAGLSVLELVFSPLE